MYCSNCGVKNDEEARFCTDCGTALEGGFASPPEETPVYGAPTYGAPPTEQTYGAPPTEQVYGAPQTSTPAYGVPPPEPVYEAPPTEQTYGAPPTEQTYGAPPPEQAYGAPPTSTPEYGAPPPEQVYGAPPEQIYGAPPTGTPAYGAPPPGATYSAPPMEPVRPTTPPPAPYTQPPSPYTPQTPYAPNYAPPPNAYAYGAQQTPPQSAGKKKSVLKIVLPIGAAVVLLAAFACIYFFTDILPFGNKPNTRKEPPIVEATPTPTPTPRPVPTAAPTPEVLDTEIPGAGGEVRVVGATEYSFTPNASGYWEMRTTDNGSSDPYLQLRDSMGELIMYDDDGADDNNSVIVVWLDGGVKFEIDAGFYSDDDSGGYTLTVRRLDETSMLSGGGGEVVVKDSSLYLFAPETSGYWEFSTSENGNSDPVLKITDMFGYTVGQDDDSGGDSNALLMVELESEQTYIVHAEFYSGIGSYKMTFLYIDDSNSGGEIPSEGGETIVFGETAVNFSPDHSGIWEIRTLDEGSSDPKLELYDSNGDLVSENDDGLIGQNAVILASLQAGETYTIKVGFFSGSEGDCIVRVSPTPQIAASGETVYVDKAMGFIFQPDTSGYWEIRTSDNYDCDPYLFLHGADGVLIANDDDSADDSSNALIIAELEAGEAYIIFAESYYEGALSYNLTVKIS